MPQQVHLRAAGLYLDPSPLAPLPDGAMLEAKNIVIRRPGVVEPRPSLVPAERPSWFNSEDRISKIWPYRGSRVVVVASDDSTGKVASWTSNQEIKDEDAASIPTTSGQRCAVETARALYFTSNKGVRRLNAATDATARLAGMPNALAGWCYDNGAATQLWLPTATAVAYRVVWVRRVSEQDLYSAPSQRFLCINRQSPAAGAGPVVNVPLPPDIIATDRLQIYRSSYISGSTEPPDDMRLIAEVEMTSSHVSAGVYTYADLYDEDERVGSPLYTNADQEGALQANTRPPRARCLAEYNGMMFYGGAQGPHEMTLTLVEGLYEFGALVGFVSVTAGVATFTVSVGAAALAKIGMYVTDGGNPDFTVAGTVFAANTRVTNVSGTTITVSPVPIATNASTIVDIGGVFKIDSTTHKGSNGSGASGEINDVVYANGNFFRFGITSPTVAADVPWGLQNLAASINAFDPTCYAVASGGVNRLAVMTEGTLVNNADRQATITIYRRDMSDTAFSVYTTNPAFFTGESLSWTVATTSTYGGGANRLAWSKKDQYGAVPMLHFQDMGAKESPILSMQKAGDSLFIFKTDGTWRVTGDTPESLRIDEFDRDLVLVHPDAACSFRDEVYCWTNRGLVAVSNGGVRDFGNAQIKSAIRAPGASMIKELSDSTPFAGSSVQMFASELRDEVYLMMTASAGINDDVEYCYVFNAHTGAWVRWTFNSDYHYVYSGAFDKASGTLLFGGYRRDTVTDSMLMEEAVHTATREHNSWGYDESFTVTISSITGNSWTIAAHANYVPKAGDILYRSSSSSYFRITAAASSTQFTTEILTGSYPASGTVTAYGVNRATVKWNTEHAGAPAMHKHWRDVFLLSEYWALIPTADVTFVSDGGATGSIDLGAYNSNESPRVFRGTVSRACARSAQMTVQATVDTILQWKSLGMGLTFEADGERFRWR